MTGDTRRRRAEAGRSDAREATRELVERARDGDPRAFRDLVTAYRDFLYGIARRFAGSHEDADDVLQEALVKIYRNLDGLTSPTAFYSWARRIVVNTALDQIRSRERTVEFEEEATHGQEAMPGGFAPPDRGVQEREFFAHLERAIRALPPRQREVVLLHDVEGLSTEEVAERCGCPRATVRSNLFYGREKLRRSLKRFRRPGSPSE
ncbi:MAG: RNA polymerase sigma factor [Gemmatimonadota bacterium]|nr:RNA polymerase sigma factor [Gemmatimonadota bacterium]